MPVVMKRVGWFPTNRAATALFPHRDRCPPLPVATSPSTRKGVQRCGQFPKSASRSEIHWESTQESTHSPTHGCNYCRERIPATVSKGDCHRGYLGETRHRLPESSPGEITQDARNSTSNKLCDSMCTTLLPGKQRLVKASAPRIFTGAGHAGTLCLHTSKSQTRSRKGGVSVNSSGLGSHLAVLGMVGTLPRSRFPEARPRVNLRSRPFNGSQSGLVG